MDKHSTAKAAKLYFLPVILGNSKHSRALARRIYRRYGSVSYIVTDKHSPFDIFGLCYRCFYLPKDTHPQLICQALTQLCIDNPYNLPLLVRTDEPISGSIADCSALLEPFFILTDAESILLDSPLTRTR